MALTHSLDLESTNSQYATAGDTASLSITGNLTLECWFKPESQPATNNNFGLLTKTNSDTQRSYKFFYQDLAGTTSLQLGISSDGSSQTNVGVNQTLSNGTWYHIAVVYTAAGGTADFYVNGSQIGTQQSGLPTSIFDSSASFALGATRDSAVFVEHADGKFALARVWSTTRTASDLSNNYCNTLGATANLAAEWSLQQVYDDTSGNSNTLSQSPSAPSFSADAPATCAASSSGSSSISGLSLLGVGN